MSRFNSGADIANPALLTQCRLGHCVFKGEANFDLICRSGEAWVTRIEVNYRSRGPTQRSGNLGHRYLS
jgi:hypothetical protein